MLGAAESRDLPIAPTFRAKHRNELVPDPGDETGSAAILCIGIIEKSPLWRFVQNRFLAGRAVGPDEMIVYEVPEEAPAPKKKKKKKRKPVADETSSDDGM